MMTQFPKLCPEKIKTRLEWLNLQVLTEQKVTQGNSGKEVRNYNCKIMTDGLVSLWSPEIWGRQSLK